MENNQKRRKLADDWDSALEVARETLYVAIAVGGGLPALWDLLQACILFGYRRIPLVIAAGLLGRQASGEASPLISRCLPTLLNRFFSSGYLLRGQPQAGFLREHPLVCGCFYGIAVELVMSYIVLPLSALHARGPYKLHTTCFSVWVCTWSWSGCRFPQRFALRRIDAWPARAFPIDTLYVED